MQIVLTVSNRDTARCFGSLHFLQDFQENGRTEFCQLVAVE
jgi:hypothetical protein